MEYEYSSKEYEYSSKEYEHSNMEYEYYFQRQGGEEGYMQHVERSRRIRAIETNTGKYRVKGMPSGSGMLKVPLQDVTPCRSVALLYCSLFCRASPILTRVAGRTVLHHQINA